MLSRLFPWLMSYGQRRWAYAIGEVMSIAVFALCSSVAVQGRAFRIGANDPGMARITAICFMALAAGTFVIVVCLKQIDHE
jgi:hypothetical protein